MAVTPKQLCAATLTTTLSSTLYAPSGVKGIVTSVSVTNVSGATANLTIKAAGVTRFAAEPIPAGGRILLGPNDIRWVIASGQTITGGASAGSALEVSIDGVEV